MKLAILTDTHAGYGNDKPIFRDIAKQFYDEVFFPCLDEYGITNVIHLGDILDRRKYINFVTLQRVNTDFVREIEKRRIKLWYIPGNHDVYHKNTNEVCGPLEIWRDHPMFRFLMEPEEIIFDDEGGCKIAFIPWICDENRDRVLKFLKETTAQVCFGHFELKGFLYYKGMVADHGDDASLLSKFDVVASGHYHHKSSQSNVHYLGSPFQFNWADHNDLRGFHIFDTETREFEFIPTGFEPFVKIKYDDAGKTLEQVLDLPLEMYKGKFVKIVVINKSNPFMFDLLVDKLEKIGVHEISIAEDHMNLDLAEDVELVGEAEDTMTLMRTFLDLIPMGVDKKALEKELHDIYQEAQTVDL